MCYNYYELGSSNFLKIAMDTGVSTIILIEQQLKDLFKLSYWFHI